MDGGGGASAEVEAKVSVDDQVIINSNPAEKLSLLTPEELVAKAIAPVKKEYLCPPPVRPCPNEANKSAKEGEIAQKTSGYSNVAKEKKSKRQLKRERHQEQKSALHVCPTVAKMGNVTACRYGSDCRYSHDIEAFKAEKPADLEGSCPFLSIEGPCPYGLACRYLGTHKEDVSSDTSRMHKRSEMNGLSKDVQKLLWKNKMTFPKADAQLKFLGLTDKLKKVEVKEEEDAQTIMNGSPTACVNDDGEVSTGSVICKPDCSQEVPLQEVSVHHAVPVDDSRPVKKAKHPIDEKYSGEMDNGLAPLENGLEKNCTLTEVETAQTDNSISETDMCLKLHPREKKLIDFRGKLYLAPLTTVGNLPFRRVCKVLGADITCGEMAMCTNLLQGQASEWALLRRHSDEDLFGVQICGAFPDTVARTVELIDRECTVDFIDINMGCPIDAVVNKGAGSCLLTKPMRMKSIIKAASSIVDKPITVKVRTAYFEGRNRIDSLIADIGDWGASAVTIHGRSRQQRYSKVADWDYIYQCASKAPDSLQVLGNGDVCSYVDWNKHLSDSPKLSACMIARGSLVKPWIFTEIKEQRHWDISSGERLDILRDYVRFGLEHWGSDTKGVETTRHFMLEWLSYTFRYVPVGLLDVIPQQLNWRPPSYYCRDDLETLMASESAADWIRISELLLGKVPTGFSFQPKHKSNAYDKAENG